MALTQQQVASALNISQAKVSRLYKANYKELEPFFVKQGKKMRLKESALPLVKEWLSEGYRTATDIDLELQRLHEALHNKDREITLLEAQNQAQKEHISTLKIDLEDVSNRLSKAEAELDSFGNLSLIKRLTWKPKK